MHRFGRLVFSFSVFGLAASLYGAVGEVTPTFSLIQEAKPLSAEVDEQVKLLDHPNLEIRTQARAALVALGENAIPHLRKHLESETLSAAALDEVRGSIKMLGGVAEPLERPKSEMKLRIKTAERSIEVTGSGGEVRISKEGKSFKFERRDDGSVRVEIRADGEVKVETYASAEDLRKHDADLHRELEAAPQAHGQANPADPSQEQGIGDGNARKDSGELQDFLDDIDALNGVNFADGDLSDEERKVLAEKARQKLEKDMQRLQEREKDNAREKDPEESIDIKKDRYRASLKALERDLIYRLAELRRPGGDQYESNLDDLDERIRDTFSTLHDKVDDGGPKDWEVALGDGRKFHKLFGDELSKWGKDINVDAKVMDVPRRITEMKTQLRDRLKRIRKHGPNRIESNLDDLEEKILDSYESLESKVRDTPPSGWPGILATAEKFFIQYSADLDKWAKEAGVDEAVASPLEVIAELRSDLLDRVGQVRRLGGDKYESELDEVEDSIKDTFADLKDKVLNRDKGDWPEIQKSAEKHYKLFVDAINLWQRKIELGSAPKDAPDRDVKLPPGEQMDVVDGVRVSRLLPLPRKQLGLDHGLSVNEIVDADKPLARAGLEVYDIITEVNGKAVDSRTELRDAMTAIERGSEFTLTIMRNGKVQEVKGKR
ncbi:MAG: PDZ domain-containing protein [Planctomycetes bacterium]|nr:PDZ domain-containing protein [Planctomycetota bacterium]